MGRSGDEPRGRGVILWSSVGLMKESVGMSLMGVPSGIDVDQVEAELAALDGVETVHDLHVWPLSTTETALTAHLVAPDVRLDRCVAAGGPHNASRPLPHRALHAAGRTHPPRRHALLMSLVTHLECSLTGERYEAGQVHNLSRAREAAAGALRPRSGGADADPRQPRGARAGHVEMARVASPRRRAGQPRRARNADRRADQNRRRRSCWSRTKGGFRPDRSRRAGWRWR